MISAPLDQINKGTLATLIAARSAESKTLEFKRDLPGRDNASRTEFLADVCAMANTAGGDIVYGLQEDDEGSAQALVGHDINPDDECLRLQNVLTDGLEPRLTGATAHPVPLAAGGFAIVLRIPRTWAGPHRSKANQHFYVREGRRKRQLDVPEIKTAIIRGQEPTARIESFRAERIAKILGGHTPVPLLSGIVEVLHVVPLDIWLAGEAVDVLQYTGEATRNLPVISGAGGNWRVNIDGALHTRNVTDRGCGAYTQLFRNGALEALRVFTTTGLPSVAFERELVGFYRHARAELVHLGSVGPLVLLFTLLRVDGALLAVSEMQRFHLDEQQGRFDRNEIVVPDIVVGDLEAPVDRQLRPLFDLVWNAAGLPKSWNFDADGNWVAHG